MREIRLVFLRFLKDLELVVLDSQNAIEVVITEVFFFSSFTLHMFFTIYIVASTLIYIP